MTRSFIKVHDDTMTVTQDLPFIDKSLNTNIPVITLIDTYVEKNKNDSSSLLDFYCHWMKKKFNLDVDSTLFCQACCQKKDLNDQGIDYQQVADKCVLMNCLRSCNKYDHPLLLICYLISNVIILPIQQLDQHMLNDLLSIFSFLPHIDKQYVKKGKSKLIIWVKDSLFQGNVKTFIDQWLKIHDSEYDVIKQALVNSFEIHCVTTQYLIGTDVLDYNFPILNPCYVNACETIYALTDSEITSDFLTNRDQMNSMIQRMINEQIQIQTIVSTESKVNESKLNESKLNDVVSTQLLEYSKNHILVYPFTDQSICDKMNGSSRAHAIYTERLQLIKDLENDTMNQKFKDVYNEIKHQILDCDFTKIKNYAETAMLINMMIAEDLVLPEWQIFQKKFDNANFETMVHGFMGVFAEAEKKFVMKLETIDIDLSVRSKYIDMLNEQRDALNEIQKQITLTNARQIDLIDQKISEWQIDHHIKIYVKEYINAMDTENMLYNKNSKVHEKIIKDDVIRILKKMYEEMNFITYLKKDQNQWIISPQPELRPALIRDIDAMIFKHSNLLTDEIKSGFTEYWYQELQHRLIEIGFLKDVEYESIPGIQFIEFVSGEFKCCMVEQFYLDKFQDVLEQITERHPYICVGENEPCNNMRAIQCLLKTDILNPGINSNKKTIMDQTLQYIVVEKIMRFCHTNDLQFV